MKNCKPGENIFQSAPQKENATRFLFFCIILVFPSSNKSQFCASNKIQQNRTISKNSDEILDKKENAQAHAYITLAKSSIRAFQAHKSLQKPLASLAGS